MLQFENPLILLLLFIIPIGIWILHFFPGRGGLIPMAFAEWNSAKVRTPSFVWKAMQIVSAAMLWVGIGLTILAAAGPMESRQVLQSDEEGVLMLLLVDVSPSMSADDFQPDGRLNAIKATLKDFIRRRGHDEIGCIAFGSRAVLLVPPTTDRAFLDDSLSGLEPMMHGTGTALGDALQLASKHLAGIQAKKKSVIVLSDGVENSGSVSPVDVARILGNGGTHLYIVGTGSAKNASLRFRNPESGEQFFGTSSEIFHDVLLKRVAAAASGTYLAADNTEALKAVLSSVDAAERSARSSSLEWKREPIASTLFFWGMLLIIAEALLKGLVFREAS